METVTEKVWDTAAGLKAAVIYNKAMGHRCGYVAVPPGHKAHGKDYSSPLLEEIEVHGGLTYSDTDIGQLIGVSDVYWFGFDCAHAWDAPNPDSTYAKLHPQAGTYRTAEFCVTECEFLARQLVEL